jgi:hypothetical protein
MNEIEMFTITVDEEPSSDPHLSPASRGWEKWFRGVMEAHRGRLDASYVDIRSMVSGYLNPDCDLHLWQLVHFEDRAGRVRYKNQCTHCWKLSREIARKDLPQGAPSISVEREDPDAKWSAIARVRTSMLDRLNAGAEAERKEKYNTYLTSPAWYDLRARVLQRSGGLCEGCGDRMADHIHHLTYERFGREMLFDLAAVCRECHTVIHNRPL